MHKKFGSLPVIMKVQQEMSLPHQLIFKARQSERADGDDLLRFFTEDPLDNVTATDQIDISLRNNLGNVIEYR